MYEDCCFGSYAFFWSCMFIIIKQEIQILIASTAILFLSGCVSAPMKLGISDSEWSSYDVDKKKGLLFNYEKISEEHKDKEDKVINDVFLKVNIHGGKVMMPPFIDWQDYKPVDFTIFKGQCRGIVLQQPMDEDSQINLGVCFDGNILYLDPSQYDLKKKNGSISINSFPLWSSGFSYKGVSSSGYARLKDVTIEIMQKKTTK
jgi:hypothetical protein